MDADIHTLYASNFYQILDFRCRCVSCRTSKPEYNESFCISFVRKGNFIFNVFRNALDSYTGCVLVTKPGYERTVTHVHDVPDECTIFEFKAEFFRHILEQYGAINFLSSNDIHSTLVKTTPETEFLHFHIVRLILNGTGTKLEIDNAVMDMIDQVLSANPDYRPDLRINDRLKRNHLITIERAKDYITRHFSSDISLMEIADYCNVSAFHFSRIFKTFTNSSPHQFLLSLRLKNAALLLRNSSLPVNEIAFSSGFNSLEHFTAAFRSRHNISPTAFRSKQESRDIPIFGIR